MVRRLRNGYKCVKPDRDENLLRLFVPTALGLAISRIWLLRLGQAHLILGDLGIEQFAVDADDERFLLAVEGNGGFVIRLAILGDFGDGLDPALGGILL